jgi:hypothetical protein
MCQLPGFALRHAAAHALLHKGLKLPACLPACLHESADLHTLSHMHTR